MPKISIITVSYNAEATIEKTINSVINQTCKDYEYILVDGNSKDRTLEIAGNYKDYIKKWISEPDKGIYDAMNKGILLAQGEYIIFLNAGNTFIADNMLERVVHKLDGHDIIYGNLDFYDVTSNKHDIKKQNVMNKTILCEDTMFIASEFIKRELLEQLGGFDTRFKTTSDKEFNLRAILKNNAKIKYIDELITVLPQDEETPTKQKNSQRYQKENAFTQKMYFNNFERWLYKLMFKHFRYLLSTKLYKFFFQIGD